MAINIQKLLDAVQAKINATTGSTSKIELNHLSSIGQWLNSYTNQSSVKEYANLAAFPTADSANHGDIAFSLDSGAYRISEQLAWREISLNADSVIAAVAGYSFQGSTSGYTSGGFPNTYNTIIDKFPFSSDGNATDVGDLTVARYSSAGQSSADNGYTSGGRNAPGGFENVIDKFPFSSDANATDVGDLTIVRDTTAGSSSADNGYNAAGMSNATNPVITNIIDKFPFSSDANATDVGDTTQQRYGGAGQSSADNGYASGGADPFYINVIEKFPFSSDTNGSDVGDLTVARFGVAGQSSTASGYTTGGQGPVPQYNVIDKFPFSSDANATDVGDMTITRRLAAGQSSTVSGYTSGGYSYTNVIDKFPFSSDANATDVGDLTAPRGYTTGQQV